MDPLSDGEGKAEAAWWHARRAMIKDSLPLCDRVFPRLFTTQTDDGLPRVNGVSGADLEQQLYTLATGVEGDAAFLERAAERALTLERMEQLRDFGRTREMDAPVLRFFSDTVEEYPNPLLGERRAADRQQLEELMDRFYSLRGWAPASGLPRPERLSELGLSETIGVLSTAADAAPKDDP
jgi:aldehyde:ferredoxin oxidoreductase